MQLINLSNIIPIVTATGAFWAIVWALYQWRLKRERFAALNMVVDAKAILAHADRVLFSITVQLENKGTTRINARRIRASKNYLYNDGIDNCCHAGTLKIRSVSVADKPVVFDWYSVPLKRSHTGTVAHDQLPDSDCEQVDYLCEFRDPGAPSEVDFWVEPRETYSLSVFAWLQPGVYAIKAFFFGEMIRRSEEDYWSHTVLLSVPAPNQSAADCKTP